MVGYKELKDWEDPQTLQEYRSQYSLFAMLVRLPPALCAMVSSSFVFWVFVPVPSGPSSLKGSAAIWDRRLL